MTFRRNFLSCSQQMTGACRDLRRLKEPGAWGSPVDHATEAFMHMQMLVMTRALLVIFCPLIRFCHLGVNLSPPAFLLPLPFGPASPWSGLPS